MNISSIETLELRRLLSGAASISGSVYQDLNANSRHEMGEAGVKKAVVYLDLNNNARLDKNEPSATTDKQGAFSLESLAAGTYRLREVTPEGIDAVRPGFFRVTLSKNTQAVRRFADVMATHASSGGLASGGVTSTAATSHPVHNTTIDVSQRSGNFDFGSEFGSTDVSGKVSFGDSGGSTQPAARLSLSQYEANEDSTLQSWHLTALDNAKSAASLDSGYLRRSERRPAVQWLLGDRNVTLTSGLKAVVRDAHRFGQPFKQELLRRIR